MKSIIFVFLVGLSLSEALEEITTQKIYWYKPYTDDPEVLAQNATLRRELMDKIIPLGKSIQMTIEKLPKGAGERFIKELDEFNDLNQQFLNLVRDDKANSKPEVDYLHDRSYPHLVDTDFSEEDMMNNFNWTSAEVRTFYKKRNIANDHYIDLQLYHHWYH
ncbi:hypothetical protein J6590_026069 [Homalodisca vitripennis]|nr:hypothetical protein J6590_026069 [Homalodisca vitripennis]